MKKALKDIEGLMLDKRVKNGCPHIGEIDYGFNKAIDSQVQKEIEIVLDREKLASNLYYHYIEYFSFGCDTDSDGNKASIKNWSFLIDEDKETWLSDADAIIAAQDEIVSVRSVK